MSTAITDSKEGGVNPLDTDLSNCMNMIKHETYDNRDLDRLS